LAVELHSRLSLVNQVSNHLADFRDIDELSENITELIQSTFDYYYVAILTVEPGQEKLRFRASVKRKTEISSESNNFEKAPVFELLIGEGIIGTVAQTGKEILANDVQKESLYRHEDTLSETRAEIAIPLMMNQRILGVLDVQSNLENVFTETDRLVLRTLAGNISIAIEGIRLWNDANKRANQLAIIHQVINRINSLLDQEELLNEVVSLIVTHFGYPHVHIFTVHPGRQKIFLEAGSEMQSRQMRKELFSIDIYDQIGLIPWVARHGETKLVNDVSKNPLYTPLFLRLKNVQSELTVALKFGGEILGVLDIQSEVQHAFDTQDQFTIETLADNIAIALRNAFLYRSEVWRRKVSDSLREVAGLLSAEVDIEELLDHILLALEGALPMDFAAIWLIADGYPDWTDIDQPIIYLAAFEGTCTQDLDIERFFTPEDVLEYNLCDPKRLTIQDAGNWLMRAIEAKAPIIRSSKSPYDPLGACLDFELDYSAIAAPLRVAGEALGVMVLAHHTSGRYGIESQTMTTAFASYAAVAIKNLSLYEAAHEQAWVSTALLQVADATRSQTNLSELLSTVIHITPMLVGVKSCLIYIFNEDGVFVPTVASGLTAEQKKIFEQQEFKPDDIPAFTQLMQEQRPVFLSKDTEDQHLVNIIQPKNNTEKKLDTESIVLIPMIARDQVLGVFLVDYSSEFSQNKSRFSIEEIFDERLVIMQGIAQQTAMAVDNIYLLKAQKEEAYLSVALLQVAQAVVSSNDLDEALVAIVRVTPILVGVKRSLIFLWDENQKVFHLSQTYGIPKSRKQSDFHLGEFPLLDAVLVENDLIVCSVMDDGEPSEDVLQYWMKLSIPDTRAITDYLEHEMKLLFALPLSVKGQIFGLFIVEEPDLVQGKGLTGGNANRRLRERRLEIIKGISQQASLAIQNELFQEEVINRERIEREMQLARQIQTTLLPRKIENLTDWDLQVIWQPAREVGGDFYDFFELPGDRLGIVIADVADKGLPAAMYMTLARTLVRSMVRQIISPAKVLERINNHLVEDTPPGMFVTLVYAVLSLKTGDLVIANAGHNRPLILHPFAKRIEQISRGGMALGVVESEQIRERHTTLKKGEYFILYTDGITEALSPSLDLYGEQRLFEVIEKSIFNRELLNKDLSALELLNEIQNSVENFLGGGLVSDDLTLMVIKRQ